MSDPLSYIKSSGGSVEAMVVDGISSIVSKEYDTEWFPGYINGKTNKNYGEGEILGISDGSYWTTSELIDIPNDAYAVIVRSWTTENDDPFGYAAFYTETTSTIRVYICDNHNNKKYVVLPIPNNAAYFVHTTSKTTSELDKRIIFLFGAQKEGVNADSVELKEVFKAKCTREIIENSNNVNASVDRWGAVKITCPSTGNTWPYFSVTPEQLGSGIGRFTFRIKTMETSSVKVYFIFTKKDGTTKYSVQGTINSPGYYSYDVDTNYLSVYEDMDTTKSMRLAVASVSNNTEEYYIIDAMCYYEKTSDVAGLPRSLNSVLNEFNNSIASLESAAGDTGNDSTLVSPSGKKFYLSVSDSGVITAMPIIPNKILYIGNSLLLGFGTHGMASYDTNSDYYALVNEYLEENGSSVNTERVQGSTFEGFVDDDSVSSWLSGNLSQYMGIDIDLVLIQLGDNVNTGQKVEEFRKSCGKLCQYVRMNCPNARCAWVGMWYSSTERMEIVRNACSKYGLTLVDITDIPSEATKNKIGANYIDSSGSIQTIQDSGVASHPSDAGMKAISERIIRALFDQSFSYTE